MGEEEAASADLERLCQGISPGVAACTYSATVRCTSCKEWFRDAHAEDEQWHPCMLGTTGLASLNIREVNTFFLGNEITRSTLFDVPAAQQNRRRANDHGASGKTYLFFRDHSFRGCVCADTDGTLEVQTRWVRNKISHLSSPSTPL